MVRDSSGLPTNRDLAGVLSGAWSGITVPSHAPNDPNFREKLFIWRQGYDWLQNHSRI